MNSPERKKRRVSFTDETPKSARERRKNSSKTQTTPETRRNLIAPLRVAESSIDDNFRTLQPQIAEKIREYGKKHILSLSQIRNKRLQIDKMGKDPDFFPRSTRFAFDLNVSQSASKMATFQTLKTETDNYLLEFKTKFKEQVIKATRIETYCMLKNLQKNFMLFIRTAVKALLVTSYIENLTPDTVVATVIAKNDNICQNIEIEQEEFKKEYFELYEISSWTVYSDEVAESNQDSDIEVEPTDTSSKIGEISDIVEHCILTPWKKYIASVKFNQEQLEIIKIITEEDMERSTEASKNLIDEENTATPETINDLIIKNTQKATKQLTAEINILKNQLSQLKVSKKDTRGQKVAPRQKETTKLQRKSKNSKNMAQKKSKKAEESKRLSKIKTKSTKDSEGPTQANRGKGTKQKSGRKQTKYSKNQN